MDPRRPRRVIRTILSATIVLFLPLALSMPAHAGLEEEAERQILLAEEDLEAGNFERAAASAASALRLDPTRYDALVVRALALKGLGHLEDSAGLLRAYRDLRGTLPLDERVEPALAEIASMLAPPAGDEDDTPAEEEVQEPPSVIAGPVTVVFTPAEDERASERAYAAARPFLGGTPATAILPLDTLLPRDDGLVVLNADATVCDGEEDAGELGDLLAAAEASVEELDPTAADEAAAAAEHALACSTTRPDPAAVDRLLAARAAVRWIAGEPEVASRLWAELFALQPDRVVDSNLSPAAQALQLDAKLRAADAPLEATLSLLVLPGWTLLVDGREHEGGRVPAGRRFVHVVGSEGVAAGAVVDLERDADATVATVAALRQAAQEAQPGGVALRWSTGYLDPLLEQGAQGVLLVNLAAAPPVVRHFDGERFLVLTASGRVARQDTPGAARSGVPRGVSAALLGGGLAATAVGVIVAAVAHRDGVALQDQMQTGLAFSDNYAGYEAARTQERVGTGLAIGGGVVAAVGGVTFVIPHKTRGEVAAR